MGNVCFLVQILVCSSASKAAISKLVVDKLYDCMVVAQQNVRSQMKLVLGFAWPAMTFGSIVFASERILMG